MSELTNYIQERIETLRKEKEEYQDDRYSVEYSSRLGGICELQAVLSKIEEIWDNLHNKK